MCNRQMISAAIFQVANSDKDDRCEMTGRHTDWYPLTRCSAADLLSITMQNLRGKTACRAGLPRTGQASSAGKLPGISISNILKAKCLLVSTECCGRPFCSAKLSRRIL